jgi:hypothetical protein
MYRQIILDAFKDNPDSKDVSRMVVLINYRTPYRDFADFHKYDPVFWEKLGDDIYNNSSNPDLAITPYCLSAGQYVMTGQHFDMDKAKDIIMKGLSIDSDHSMLQTYAKTAMLYQMGMLEDTGTPSRDEMISLVKDKCIEALDELEALMEEVQKEAA